PADEHPDHSQREQDGAERQVVRGGNGHRLAPGPSAGRPLSGGEGGRRLPRTTAPIIPIRSTIEAASNGRRKREKRARPTSCTVPNADPTAAGAMAAPVRTTSNIRPNTAQTGMAAAGGSTAGTRATSPLRPGRRMMTKT